MARLAVAAPIALLLIWFNPFGAFDALNSLSRFIALRALSAHMPPSRIPTVVVLVDDDWLRSRASRGLSASWPLGASEWAGIVSRVARSAPRALALDVAFLDDRADPGLKLLNTVLAHTGERIPLMIAAGSSEAGALKAVSTAAEPLTRNGGPLRLTSVVVHGDPSMLHSYSFRGDSAGHPNIVRALVDATAPTRLPSQIELLWRSPPTEECELLPEGSNIDPITGCARAPNNWFSSVVQTTVAGVFSGFCDEERRTGLCRIVPPVYFTASPVPTLTLSALEDPRRATRLDPLLKGAVVFVGQDFAFVQDRAFSPVYGAIPGVATHAVAFENAVSLPKGGLADPETFWGKLVAQVFAVLAFLVLLGSLEQLIRRCKLEGEVAGRAIELAALAGGWIVVGWISSRHLHYGPGNWLGISAASAGALKIADMLLWLYLSRIRAARAQRRAIVRSNDF